MEHAVPVLEAGGWAEYGAPWNTLPPLHSSRPGAAWTRADLCTTHFISSESTSCRGAALSDLTLLCTPPAAMHTNSCTEVVTPW